MQLLAWGANNYGQLGIGSFSEQETVPRVVNLDKLSEGVKVKKIVGGGGHSALVTEQGDLFMCGWNHAGQLGLGHSEKVNVFTKVDLSGEFVTQVAAGWDFTIVVTNNGKVFSCGSNAFGQLGLGATSKSSLKVISRCAIVPELQKITSVSCGLRHAGCCDSEGNVFVWGSGSKGQLGLGTKIKKVDKPTCISDMKMAKSISCGQYFTLISGPRLIGFGDNKHGQLALKECGSMLKPTVIDLPREIKYHNSSIFCGWTHAILHDGDSVFTWGRNCYNQLGLGHNEDSTEPRHVISGVKKVVSGSEHGMCLTNSGRLLSWGWNEHGNCGVGTSENVRVPSPISVDEGVKIEDIFAGSAHCFALTK